MVRQRLILYCKKQLSYNIFLGGVLDQRCLLLIFFFELLYLTWLWTIFIQLLVFNFLIPKLIWMSLGQVYDLSSRVRTLWKHYGSHIRDIWLGGVIGGCLDSIYDCRRFGWREHVQMCKVWWLVWPMCYRSLNFYSFTSYSIPSFHLFWINRCATYVRARKQLSIHEAPNILTIVLKRFQVPLWITLRRRSSYMLLCVCVFFFSFRYHYALRWYECWEELGLFW